MNFETFRGRFSEPDRAITHEQFRALSLKELDDLILEGKLSRPDAGQARLFHSAELGMINTTNSSFLLLICF
jgi:hypothetical protein